MKALGIKTPTTAEPGTLVSGGRRQTLTFADFGALDPLQLRGTEGVHYWKAKSIVCEPLDSNPVYAQIDGEPLACLPVEFKIVPRALKLLVPRNAAAAGIAAQSKN